MAKAKTKVQAESSMGDEFVIADGEKLNLRNRNLAAVLGWLIPGAGHFYQRRYFKSAIFSISIFTTFLIGMFLAGGRCVYASWNQAEKRWQYALQLGIGLPAMPAAVQAWRSRNNELPIMGGFMAAPISTAELDQWHADTASGFDMGTLYTMVAGLLNLLVAFDAHAGPLPPPTPKQKRGRGKSKDNEDLPEKSTTSKLASEHKSSPSDSAQAADTAAADTAAGS